MQTRALVLLLAVLLLPGRVFAQSVGELSGRVLSAATGSVVAGAEVRVTGTVLRTLSDAEGRFRLTAVPVGVRTLEVRAIGFRPIVRPDVVIGTGRPATVEIRLEPLPVDLGEIVATPSAFRAPVDAPVSTQTLTAEEVRRSPGAQEDVIRAISLLPGVAVTSAARNDLIVRGGAPFENLFTVDGIPVANPNHFGSQGSSGGPTSLITIDFVEGAEFSAGGFGVAAGDRTGSATTVTLRDGNADRRSGQLNLSATGFSALAEGPLGEKTTFLASARRSYLDLLFQLAGLNFIPQYYDATVKLTHRASPRDRVSFLFIGATDRLSFNNDTEDNRFDNRRVPSINQDQYLSGITWQRAGERAGLVLTLGRTWTRYRTFQNDSLLQEIFRSRATEGETTLRGELSSLLGPVTLRTGAQLGYASALRYDANLPGELRTDADGTPRALAVDTSFTAWRGGAWVEAVRSAGPLSLTLGVRGDGWGTLSGTPIRVSPRASAALAVGEATSLTASVGRYTQGPSPVWLAGDPANGRTLRPIVADQVVLGVQRLLRPDLKLQVEGYAKAYRDYPARVFRPQAVLAPSGFEEVRTDIPFGLEPLVGAGRGRSIGVEAFLQKRLSAIPVYGLASVSVNRTTFEGLDGVERSGSYDTRLIANLVGGWRPNARWEVGARFRLATGAPTTPFTSEGRLDFTRYNAGDRLPTFHALDVRVDRRWSWRGTQLIGYIDIQNIYGRANVSQFEWNERLGRAEPNESIGVLPSIGLNLTF